MLRHGKLPHQNPAIRQLIAERHSFKYKTQIITDKKASRHLLEKNHEPKLRFILLKLSLYI